MLDGDPPTVTVDAAYSKHRRLDVLPLHASLVNLIRPWLATKQAEQKVWPGNWAKDKKAGAMLKHDLNAAGIPYVDKNGLFSDFHALRHRFITNGCDRHSALTFPRFFACLAVKKACLDHAKITGR